MAIVRFTEQATDDIDRIATYISTDSPQYAKNFVKRILEKISKLTSFPEMGRIVPEYNAENVRELVYGNYRIIYKIDLLNDIDILAVVSSYRLLSNESLFD